MNDVNFVHSIVPQQFYQAVVSGSSYKKPLDSLWMNIGASKGLFSNATIVATIVLWGGAIAGSTSTVALLHSLQKASR